MSHGPPVGQPYPPTRSVDRVRLCNGNAARAVRAVRERRQPLYFALVLLCAFWSLSVAFGSEYRACLDLDRLTVRLGAGLPLSDP